MVPDHGVRGQWEHFLMAGLMAGAGMLVLLLVDVVPRLGQYIPQDDVATDYRLGFLWAGILWLGLFFCPVREIDKRALLWIWPVKMVVVLGAMLLVESHYRDNDSFMYFAAPQRDGFRWTGFAFGEGTSNVISLSWLHQQIIPDSYHAMKVSFAMVGLMGIYLLYRAGVRFLGREDIRVFYLLALFPSILFWSSIIGKDPIMLLGISLYIYGVVGVYTYRTSAPRRVAYMLVLVMGVIVASLIRVWLGPILLAPLAVFVLLGSRNIFAQIFLIMLVVGALVGAVTLTTERFNLAGDRFDVESSGDLIKTTDYLSKTAARGAPEGGGSSQAVTEFRDFASMAKFVPLGAFTALFRPLPGEVLNPFGFLASLENLVLLLLLLRAMSRSSWKDLREPLVGWAITVILVWSVVYGFASTQNLGAAVRWKLQVLPLLVGVLCYLGRRRGELLGHRR
jgi:hypothetical protein